MHNDIKMWNYDAESKYPDINGKRVKRMTIADIAEFKGFVKDTLIKKYDMNEMEAACAVRDSCLSEALETDNDFVEHDSRS